MLGVPDTRLPAIRIAPRSSSAARIGLALRKVIPIASGVLGHREGFTRVVPCAGPFRVATATANIPPGICIRP